MFHRNVLYLRIIRISIWMILSGFIVISFLYLSCDYKFNRIKRRKTINKMKKKIGLFSKFYHILLQDRFFPSCSIVIDCSPLCLNLLMLTLIEVSIQFVYNSIQFYSNFLLLYTLLNYSIIFSSTSLS